MRDLDDVRVLIRSRSPFGPDRTENVIDQRFASLPRRLTFALGRWPLDSAAVLDVGCSWGHCLAHFGPGSMGIDSSQDHVEFCRALGLDARLADANAAIPAPDGAFDFVWVSDVIEHLDAPRLLLRAAAPKLKPDGRLLLFLTLLPRVRLARKLLRVRGIRRFDADAHHYQFTIDTACHMVERAGYSIESICVPMKAGSLLRGITPRAYIEARPDAIADSIATNAEQRNRADAG